MVIQKYHLLVSFRKKWLPSNNRMQSDKGPARDSVKNLLSPKETLSILRWVAIFGQERAPIVNLTVLGTTLHNHSRIPSMADFSFSKLLSKNVINAFTRAVFFKSG